MPRASWPLRDGRPSIQAVVELPSPAGARSLVLLADTGAGSAFAASELLLEEKICRMAAFRRGPMVRLAGAFAGTFRTYVVKIGIPDLGFGATVLAVGIESMAAGFDGIAAFRLLNRFSYGNFGSTNQFGLEVPSKN